MKTILAGLIGAIVILIGTIGIPAIFIVIFLSDEVLWWVKWLLAAVIAYKIIFEPPAIFKGEQNK